MVTSRLTVNCSGYRLSCAARKLFTDENRSFVISKIQFLSYILLYARSFSDGSVTVSRGCTWRKVTITAGLRRRCDPVSDRNNDEVCYCNDALCNGEAHWGWKAEEEKESSVESNATAKSSVANATKQLDALMAAAAAAADAPAVDMLGLFASVTTAQLLYFQFSPRSP